MEKYKDYDRNYKEEEQIIKSMAKVLKPYISANDIKDKLEKNRFNGVYLVDDFASTRNALGEYKKDDKVILLDKEYYKAYKQSAIHEMGHAYLDGTNAKKLDSLSPVYGIGLEEGAMSILEISPSINKLKIDAPTSYPEQVRAFKQLDILYNYSDSKSYENLLVHLFKEPTTFLPMIKDIYDDIFCEKYAEHSLTLSYRSALAMVAGNDLLVNHDNNKLFSYLMYLNSLYLNIADEKALDKYKNIFIKSTDFERTREENMFIQLSGNEKIYYKGQEENLRYIIDLLNLELEKKYDDTQKRLIKKM